MKGQNMIVKKISFITLLSLFVLGNVPYLYSKEMNNSQMKRYKEIDRLLFQTGRSAQQVKQILASGEALYNELEKKNELVGLTIAYALFYEASYMMPKYNIKFDQHRIKNYKKARIILEDSLDLDVKDKETLANLYLTQGLVVGELAAITESAILVFKSRKSLEKALSISPKIQNGGIYVALGRMYDRVPKMLFGSKDKALKYLKMAQTQFPKPNIISFFYEAELLIAGRPVRSIPKPEKTKILEVLKKGVGLSKLRRMTPEEVDAIKYMNISIKELSA